MSSTVLVVDDRAALRRALASELVDAGFRVVEARDGGDAWARFRRDPPDLVITDVVMPRSDGLELLGRIRSRSEVPVIVFSAHGSIESAVAAIKSGADEFVASEDLDPEGLVDLAGRLLARGAGRDAHLQAAEQWIGESPAARRTRDRILGLASLREPVLLAGETGTGRDTAAHLLHELGCRPRGEWLVVRPEGADRDLKLPTGGTVYLDGIELFSPDAQRRWRSLLEREHHPRAPRFLASSSPTLRLRLEEGSFDRPLGERLLRFEVRLPSLRERPEDVPRIARALATRSARELGRPGVSLAPAALDRLRCEPWPGNVAELALMVEKAVAFATSPLVGAFEVEEILAEFRLSVASLRDEASREERRRLVEALESTGGNVTRVAELLGRSRAAVYRLVEKHGVPLRRER
jgi:DNA-binding NtrC family response regulator